MIVTNRFRESHSVHRVGVVFSVLKIILAFVLLGLASGLPTDIQNSNPTESNLNAEAANALFAMLKHLGVVAAVVILVIEFIHVASICLRSRGLNITYIVLASLAVVYVLVSASIPLLGSAVLKLECLNMTQNCYNCPTGTAPAACVLAAGLANKDCWYYSSDYELLCENALPKLSGVTAIMYVLAVLVFIASILGCVGCNRLDTQPQVRYFAAPQ